MSILELYIKVTKLAYDESLAISFIEMDEIYNECRRQFDWEFIKDPMHPVFKEYYFNTYGREFNFAHFLEYYFIPFYLQYKCKIIVEELGVGLIISKKYLGCEHDFETIKHYGVDPFGNEELFKTELRCKKCGHEQE